jgi:hypothetical protein
MKSNISNLIKLCLYQSLTVVMAWAAYISWGNNAIPELPVLFILFSALFLVLGIMKVLELLIELDEKKGA